LASRRWPKEGHEGEGKENVVGELARREEEGSLRIELKEQGARSGDS